jgi:hypothetical protein
MSEYSQALNEVSKIIIRQEIVEDIDTETFMTETKFSNNSVIEYMEKANLDDEIIHWENKLKHIEWEYSHSMTTDWPKIRERQLFFIREIARLKG